MSNSRREISIGQIALVAITRGALGAGIGLLVADKLSRETRKGAGIALAAIGAITTIPLLIDVFGCSRSTSSQA